MGLTCSDQRHPGSKTPRPRVWLPTLTTSTFPFPSLNGRVSSGLLRDCRCNAVICLLQRSGVRTTRGYHLLSDSFFHIFGIRFLGLGPTPAAPDIPPSITRPLIRR